LIKHDPLLKRRGFFHLKIFWKFWVFIGNDYTMKKVLRLTENDLIRIVKRVINEQATNTPVKKYDKIKVMMNLKPGSPNSTDVVTLIVREVGGDFITVVEGDDEASRYGFLSEPQKFNFNPIALSITDVGDIIEINGVQTQNGKVLLRKPNGPTKPKPRTPQPPKPTPNSFIGKTVNFYFDEQQQQILSTFRIDSIENKNQTLVLNVTDLRGKGKDTLTVRCDQLITALKRGVNPNLQSMKSKTTSFFNRELTSKLLNKFCKADFAQSGQQSQEPMV
jgi:hypothetical protein